MSRFKKNTLNQLTSLKCEVNDPETRGILKDSSESLGCYFLDEIAIKASIEPLGSSRFCKN